MKTLLSSLRAPGQVFQPFLLFGTLLAAGLAPAQDLDRILPPKEGRAFKVDPGVVDPPAGIPAPFDPQSREQVVDFGVLKGVVLISDPADLETPPPGDGSGVHVLDESLTVPPKVLTKLQPFIGKPFNVVTLREMRKASVLAYRASDLPIVDVLTPPQEITSGVIRMAVIVGKLEDVRVTETRYFSERSILGPVRLERGDLIYRSDIIRDLRAINRNPFRSVSVGFTPGDEFGHTDLILQVDERRPWTVFSGYTNNGSDSLGEHRVNFGFETGNLWNAGHLLTYQYTTTPDFDRLDAHAASYRLPLFGGRHQLNLIGGHVQAEGELPFEGEMIQTGGRSYQLSSIWLAPLPDFRGISHELHLGFDYKSTNNNLEFGGLEVIDSTAEIFQFSLGQAGQFETGFGDSKFYHGLFWSPGDLSNHNSDESFQELRGLASADYLYWKGNFLHAAELPWNFDLALRVEGQLSNANLLPVEAMLIGGARSVRGFDEVATQVDRGILANLELYPPIPYAKATKARPFLFYDYATGSNIDLLPDEAESISAGSFGVGLNYEILHHFNLRASYGWQAAQSGFEDDINARWHLYGSFRF